MARHREAVTRPIEPPDEPWAFTPEPELPGLGVSFAMTSAEVRRALDKAGVKYEHHPERTDRPPGGNVVFSRERIDAHGRPPFEGVYDLIYVFEGGRLEEVRFFATRQGHDLDGLVKPWRLKPDGALGWTGLDGTIRIHPSIGNGEGTWYVVRLNYRGR